MKKLYIIIFLIFWGTVAFADTGNQKEIDFLLFLANSDNQFADNAQAITHLDTVAHYLKGRNILPGQIYVYGYAANVTNNIDPIHLSTNRALFVIHELQRRGIGSNLFADPVGYGQVNLWGGNTNEPDRSPNRRVRILVEDTILTPALAVTEPVAVIPPEKPAEEPSYSFLWWLLPLPLLAAIAAIIFFEYRRKKNAPAKLLPVAVHKAKPSKEKIIILKEDVIRLYAYKLYNQRNGQKGDAVGDWYQSICELTAHYKTLGYRVILYWEQEAQTLQA
ncbi:MAG: hypothetical protein LBV17_12680 [Treponema sp.]|nr:hypothetical protein [Treponema sp.]